MSSEFRSVNRKHIKKREGELPPSRELILGPLKTREQVMRELRAEPEIFQEFQKLSPELKEEVVEFIMGVRGLKVTYDPVFRKIFNPEVKPERLEELLSLCLGKRVKIFRVLPGESERLTEEGSLLVMDMLVQLASKSLANMEIQRVGYLFPGARCACYSSDLLMRQYSQVREDKRKRRKRFSYRDIKRVYTIVLIQQSTGEFHRFPEEYLHYFKQRSNTGLELDMLQEYLLIPLDIFQESIQNRSIFCGPQEDNLLICQEQEHGRGETQADRDAARDERGSRRLGGGRIRNKLEAWLTFIASDRPEDIMEVVTAYPEFRGLYQEVFEFRYQKRELINMYSKALSILDANTVEYMVEQQKKEIRKLTKALENKDRELERLRAMLEAQGRTQ